MQVTVHAAKTQLSRLIDAALSGQDVVIAKGQQPVARLVPIKKGQFRLGILKDQLKGKTPDFLAPLSADDLDLWEGR